MQEHSFAALKPGRKISKRKLAGLCCILLAALVFYILNATKTGLWYDEAVEYFYSKYMTGTVPGGIGTANMFERIRITFQPPLYNVLMWLWLNVFDSEFAFRFAGILFTLIGSFGIFLAIEEIMPKGIWSNLGTFFYLFSYGIIYYVLECAEYNLMLCFMAWAVYFFVRVLKRKDTRSIIGFFAFCCLALYSQYGAAFIILGMGLALLFGFISRKEYVQLKRYILTGIISVTVAVVPLILIFMIPQMNNQGSASVSHSPYFAGGFIHDIAGSIKVVLQAMFGQYTVYIVLVLLLVCLAALFFRFREMIWPVIALAIAWTVYFVAVCCSFYGYNRSWNAASYGTMNLGGKYSFFFIPAAVVTIVIGLGMFTEHIKEKNKTASVIITAVLALCIAFAGVFEVYRTEYRRWPKDDDDVRELTLVWYDMELYESETLLFQWDDALFNFYLTHDARYEESYSESVEAAEVWIRTADYDEMHDGLEEMGYLAKDEFYYVTSATKDNPNFMSVMEDEGYESEVICSGRSVLLHLTKK